MIWIASGVNKLSLLAISCFVLTGALMAEGGMARRLVTFAGVLVDFVRGGLSLVNILASTFFGAISGSSVADTPSIGSVLTPEIEKNGYPRTFSIAVTVSGSVQAILVLAIGIDPVHFGMIMLVNLGIGLITPRWAQSCSSAPRPPNCGLGRWCSRCGRSSPFCSRSCCW